MVVMFYLVNPGRRSSHAFKVKGVGIQQFVEVHIAVVAGDNLGLGLQGTNHLSDLLQLAGCHH